MNKFEKGESVICYITVKDISGDLQDPATSMKIVVERDYPNYASLIASVTMTNDAVGAYQFTCSTDNAMKGIYTVTYTAIDGTKTTKQTDQFELI